MHGWVEKHPILEIMEQKNITKDIVKYKLDDNLNLYVSGSTSTAQNQTAFGYWSNFYYPEVIKYSYPVYMQERSLDKGKHAFEIIKVLKDKKLVNLSKVSDFIDLMDELIKIL